MTESDLTQIEFKLGIRLPVTNRDFILSDSAQDIQMLFSTVDDVLFANQCARQTCSLGRPLPRPFYIFGLSEGNRELFFDLDFPEPPVMVVDYEHKRGTVLAHTFRDWILPVCQFNRTRS